MKKKRTAAHRTLTAWSSLRLTGGLFLFLSLLLFSCSREKKKADLIVHNAVVYTVDSSFTTVQSFAVKNGKIIATGSNSDILDAYSAEQMIDAGGKAVFPGFIDAHCHFYGYGQTLHSVNLVGTKSFDEVIERTIEFSKTANSEWIVGRGWDQNDWKKKEFPTRAKLDSLFPDRPVMLTRIDGHAAIVNGEALKRAGITEKIKVNGGKIETNETAIAIEENVDFDKAGRKIHPASTKTDLTGILIDNAVDLVTKVIPQPTTEEIANYLLDAQKNCFEVGLTTVDDAGLMKNVIDVMDQLHKQNKLKIRIYAMLSDSAENYNYYMQHGPYKTPRLNVRSFKFYGDGALGSRGACLLQPYSDDPKNSGFLLNSADHYREKAILLAQKGFQVNTHCIGDSAVRLIMNIYSSVLYDHCKGNSKEPADKQFLRWRIEHFQVSTPGDIEKMKCLNKQAPGQLPDCGIIPSVQPTHATSDMYWAKERLGDRVKYAYAYKDQLKAAGLLALGTDFPVESINPMTTFYAAVTRTDKTGFPKGGFQPENALTREETLRGMTIWAAYSNFEEKEKGSIETGKYADFVILDNDIMKMDMKDVLSTKVIATYVNGEKVYGK